MSEQALGLSWDGSVILDIGDDVGALLLRTSAAMVGREIDLLADDADVPPTHSAVRVRQTSCGLSYAAVYPHLKAGEYRVEGSTQRVLIMGGHVTDVEFAIDAGVTARAQRV